MENITDGPNEVDLATKRYCDSHKERINEEYNKLPETDGGRIISEEIFEQLIQRMMERDGVLGKDPAQLEREARWRKEDADMLADLLEIDEPEFVLTWQFRHGMQDSHWLIVHGGRILYERPAYYEDYRLFERAARVLKQRYGTRVKDLIPSEEHQTGIYLYGDYMGSIGVVKAARQMLANPESLCVETPTHKVLLWEDLKDLTDRAFDIWTHSREKEWGKSAWGLLISQGGAHYSNEIERHEALIMFLALAGFYHDFCAMAWEERDEPMYSYWAEEVGLSNFILGQLVGREHNLEEDEALKVLVSRARPKVVEWLRQVHAGPDKLFCSLWRTNDWDTGADEDGEEHECELTDDQILNDLTADKMSAYEWLDQGAEEVLEH
jgi:hypothetical protein